jgi:hypothetical protein
MDGRGAITALATKGAISLSPELKILLSAFDHLQPDMTYIVTGWAGYKIRSVQGRFYRLRSSAECAGIDPG